MATVSISDRVSVKLIPGRVPGRSRDPVAGHGRRSMPLPASGGGYEGANAGGVGEGGQVVNNLMSALRLVREGAREGRA